MIDHKLNLPFASMWMACLDYFHNKASRMAAVCAVYGFLLLFAPVAVGQVCSHLLKGSSADIKFYATNGYVIRQIDFRSPYDFLFFVHHRLLKIKESLAIHEGHTFTVEDYNTSADVVKTIIESDNAFGSSLAKISVRTASIENCQESVKTIDVIYRVFTTDPMSLAKASPEDRRTIVEQPATASAERSTDPSYKLQPGLGYYYSALGGGGDFLAKVPGTFFSDFHISGYGSSSSRALIAQLNGSRSSQNPLLDRLNYHLSYSNSEVPASQMQLTKNSLNLRFVGFSRPLEAHTAKIMLRYGTSFEKGIQQSTDSAIKVPQEVIEYSGYNALRIYAGATSITRYSEASVSYGLQVSAKQFGEIDFVKQVGDATFSLRFPGHTHSPWDLQMRLTAGGISGSSILLSERFFGGNSINNFIPGDSWQIPDGPLIRSIPGGRLTGTGIGGTSFYSLNTTVGKAIKGWPLISRDIEETEGFASGIEAAEATAERFFADDNESSSAEFKYLAIDYGNKLKADLDAVQKILQDIRASGQLSPELQKLLKNAEDKARQAGNLVRHATIPSANGRLSNALEMRTFNNPTNSKILKLTDSLAQLQPYAQTDARSRLAIIQATIKQHVNEIGPAIDSIHSGPVGKRAAAQATKDMARPREVIDTLRYEVNQRSFSLVAIFDSCSLWPDPLGTRYAIGGGGRFSLFNLNFTAGYAFNPQPRRVFGQGRGALFFSLSYTNLFQ